MNKKSTKMLHWQIKNTYKLTIKGLKQDVNMAITEFCEMFARQLIHNISNVG